MPKKPPAKGIKTGKWQRQWALTKAGVSAGANTTGKMWGNAFLGKEKREHRNKKVIGEQAQLFADELGKLKGSVVKVGQMMALYGEHILPEEVTNALASLQENTKAIDFSLLKPSLQKALGDDFATFTFDETAIGAASLAQVHKAVDTRTGQTLCFKVQYPGVSDAIDSDLDAIWRLLTWTRMLKSTPHTKEWFESLKELLHQELDYHREAKMTQQFSEFVKNDAIFKTATIYPSYCSKNVLAASFEAGFAVSAPEVSALAQPRKNRLAKAFLELFFKEMFVFKTLQTDPNFGNYRVQIDATGQQDKVVLLDFGSVVSYDDSFIKPVKQMIVGALQKDQRQLIEGAIALGIMQEGFPEQVLEDFAALCYLLVEPFQNDIEAQYLNSQGEYCWAKSLLPKRAAKHAAKSAMSRYFVMPPKEFSLLSRKLLGVYSFIASLDAQFNSQELVKQYLS